MIASPAQQNLPRSETVVRISWTLPDDQVEAFQVEGIPGDSSLLSIEFKVKMTPTHMQPEPKKLYFKQISNSPWFSLSKRHPEW